MSLYFYPGSLFYPPPGKKVCPDRQFARIHWMHELAELRFTRVPFEGYPARINNFARVGRVCPDTFFCPVTRIPFFARMPGYFFLPGARVLIIARIEGGVFARIPIIARIPGYR